MIHTPEEIFLDGTNNKVPIIIGSNRDEMAFWTIKSVPSTLTEAGFDQTVQSFSKGRINASALVEIKNIYSNATTGSYPYPKKRGKYSQWWWEATRVATDAVPGLGCCSVRNVARLLVDSYASASGGSGSKVYVYLFAHPTQTPVPLPGDGKGSVTVGHATGKLCCVCVQRTRWVVCSNFFSIFFAVLDVWKQKSHTCSGINWKASTVKISWHC